MQEEDGKLLGFIFSIMARKPSTVLSAVRYAAAPSPSDGLSYLHIVGAWTNNYPRDYELARWSKYEVAVVFPAMPVPYPPFPQPRAGNLWSGRSTPNWQLNPDPCLHGSVRHYPRLQLLRGNLVNQSAMHAKYNLTAGDFLMDAPASRGEIGERRNQHLGLPQNSQMATILLADLERFQPASASVNRTHSRASRVP